eukprot:TRINITY_DN12_c0_g1_i1.p1 TRINITY_DN12_c0_g1~~TRINITY_DN12_c0_g1_i1.p1  ORF type:complete len:140 (-),score=37.52 TRINITY_DN12_c0_g1_i1:651-1070(-)
MKDIEMALNKKIKTNSNMGNVQNKIDAVGEVFGIQQTIVDIAERGDEVRFEQMLEEGHDINERDRDGNTPIMMAVIAGQGNMVQYLLEKGADFTIGDNIGFQPLHRACQHNDIPLVNLLLDANANVDSKNHYGNYNIGL